MHLQRKNKIICLERGSAALVVNGLLTHPVNLPCLLPHTHTTASGLVVLMLNELVLHVPALWKRLLKKRNCSCQSSTPLALNHVYFAIIYRLFSLSCCEIVNRFPLFQHSCYLFIFSFFPLQIVEMQNSTACSKEVIIYGNLMPPSFSVSISHSVLREIITIVAGGQ